MGVGILAAEDCWSFTGALAVVPALDLEDMGELITEAWADALGPEDALENRAPSTPATRCPRH